MWFGSRMGELPDGKKLKGEEVHVVKGESIKVYLSILTEVGYGS